MTTYELHWIASYGERLISTPDIEAVKHWFNVCSAAGWPCKLVKVERVETILDMDGWPEC